MKQFSVSTMIGAPPEGVWAVLVDGSRWTAWDSGVESFQGRIAQGERVRVGVKANPGRTFPVTVTRFDPPRGMVWTGGLPLGLFTGRRTYTLAPANGGTQFSMEEHYTGALAGLMGRSIPDLTGSFRQFAAGLKQEAERLR